jgi:hypothetical protein
MVNFAKDTVTNGNAARRVRVFGDAIVLLLALNQMVAAAPPADGPIVGRRNGPTLGLRYDLNDHAAFKLQYDHLAQRGQKSFNALETQFSFAF